MKTLQKWNFFIALLMICTIPFFTGCGSDDDKNPDEEPGMGYIGWKDSGNTATFGYKVSSMGYTVSAIWTLTFDGSGDGGKCTKCVLEETYPTAEIAAEVEADYKNEEGHTNVKRNGNKVSHETDDFIGQTRKFIRTLLESIHFPK